MSNMDATGGSTARRWCLDPARSLAEFRVPTFWGLIRVKGWFDRLDGWLEVEHDGRRQLELTIDAASLHTGNEKRDRHLRSADFFDTERHPQVRFVSNAIVDRGDGRLHVEGDLLAAGSRVALQLDPIVWETPHQVRVDASTTVDQRDLGMTWGPFGITRTPTTLTVHAQLRPAR